MKTKLVTILGAAAAMATLFGMAACSFRPLDIEYAAEVSGDTLVVFVAPEIPEDRKDVSVKDYLDGLVANEVITMVGDNSEYGYFITSVNGKAAQTNNNADGSSYGMSWSLYTDFFTEGDVVYADPAYQSYEYNGKLLGYANYGVSNLPLVTGYTYALVYEDWSYAPQA